MRHTDFKQEARKPVQRGGVFASKERGWDSLPVRGWVSGTEVVSVLAAGVVSPTWVPSRATCSPWASWGHFLFRTALQGGFGHCSGKQDPSLALRPPMPLWAAPLLWQAPFLPQELTQLPLPAKTSTMQVSLTLWFQLCDNPHFCNHMEGP